MTVETLLDVRYGISMEDERHCKNTIRYSDKYRQRSGSDAISSRSVAKIKKEFLVVSQEMVVCRV